jgi:hypothetical protein
MLERPPIPSDERKPASRAACLAYRAKRREGPTEAHEAAVAAVLPLPWKEASAEAVNAGRSDCKVLLLVSSPARKMEKGPSPKGQAPFLFYLLLPLAVRASTKPIRVVKEALAIKSSNSQRMAHTHVR